MARCSLLLALGLVALTLTACSGTADSDSDTSIDTDTQADTDADTASVFGDGVMPGGACDCDTDCAATTLHPGLCLGGVCMNEADGTCSAVGSSDECPTDSRCWGLGDGLNVCYPDCSDSCVGGCDGDGSCVPDETSSCDPQCGTACEVDTSEFPGEPAACEAGVGGVADWQCSAGCSDLVSFNPRQTTAYHDYPLNGETEGDQYRSFIRRDTRMLVQYAADMVECQAVNWPHGNGAAIGLGDMSESQGEVPGTSTGSPAHPVGTHLDGADIDVAYYQLTASNNFLRAVCDHYTNGADQYHCVSAPDDLDVWRTALFIGHLHAGDGLRVLGVDGQIGPLLEDATAQLCADGWLSGDACTASSMAYETTDESRGWYYFHHHHMHVSTFNTP